MIHYVNKYKISVNTKKERHTSMVAKLYSIKVMNIKGHPMHVQGFLCSNWKHYVKCLAAWTYSVVTVSYYIYIETPNESFNIVIAYYLIITLPLLSAFHVCLGDTSLFPFFRGTSIWKNVAFLWLSSACPGFVSWGESSNAGRRSSGSSLPCFVTRTSNPKGDWLGWTGVDLIHLAQKRDQ